MLSALGRGGTVGMFHYLAHGMNLVRVVKDNVHLMLWEDHNVFKKGSLIIHVGQGVESLWCEEKYNIE